MNPNKALWEKGDFTRIAALMRGSGEAVVASLGVAPPLKALDLGCGDGTTAVPLAQRGAEVVGIDIASNLVAAGRKRAAAAGLDRLTFHEGDACNLAGGRSPRPASRSGEHAEYGPKRRNLDLRHLFADLGSSLSQGG